MNQINEIKVRQNRTLDPPSKTRSISSNNGPATIHSSFINTPQNPSPQNVANNSILAF